MRRMAKRDVPDRLDQPAQEETPEQALKRMGFAGSEPIAYFPAAVAVIVPGLGQFLNSRFAPFQVVKTFLFAWFIWMTLQRGLAGEPAALLIAALLFVASALDFLWTRRSYNQRLAAAKERLGYDVSSAGSAERSQLPPASAT